MLTPLGKQIRKYRLDKEMTLYQMASILDISSAYLSSIETGKRNIMSDLLERIISFLGLNKKEAENMRHLADQSQHTIKLSLEQTNNSLRELAIAFSRSFYSLTADQIDMIRKILDK